MSTRPMCRPSARSRSASTCNPRCRNPGRRACSTRSTACSSDPRMPSFLEKSGAWLRRRAENIAAGLLAAMFLAFIVQIVFRYLFNFPIGWSTELTLITWLYLVLFGSAFVLTEKEEIRFDLIYGA